MGPEQGARRGGRTWRVWSFRAEADEILFLWHVGGPPGAAGIRAPVSEGDAPVGQDDPRILRAGAAVPDGGKAGGSQECLFPHPAARPEQRRGGKPSGTAGGFDGPLYGCDATVVQSGRIATAIA